MSLRSRQPDELGPAIDAAGKYRLGAQLGAGGMAEVFRGYVVGAEGFERAVAIKRVLANYSHNARFAEMFTTEARLASMLSHPCVVGILDFDRDAEGRLYQILEFVAGVDLERLAPPGQPAGLSESVILYVIHEVLEGLAHAHQAVHPGTGKPLGIVHRDCTPSNVMLSWDGVVKVSDFGIAKAMQATNVTFNGAAGKPTYMAPEQIVNSAARPMDGRVDLFAVGVMLWELLTGQRPFASVDGAADSAMGIMFRVSQYGQSLVDVRSPYDVTAGRVPMALSSLAMRLMSPRPDDRPATAQVALAELRSCGRIGTRDELSLVLAQRFPDRAPRSAASLSAPLSPHTAPTVIERGLAGPPSTPTASMPSGAGELALSAPATRSRRPLALSIGAGLVALVVAAVAMLAGGDQPSPPAAAPSPAVALPPIDGGAPDAPPAAIQAETVDAGMRPVDAQPIDAAPRHRPPPHRRDAGAGSGHQIIEKNLGGGS